MTTLTVESEFFSCSYRLYEPFSLFQERLINDGTRTLHTYCWYSHGSIRSPSTHYAWDACHSVLRGIERDETWFWKPLIAGGSSLQTASHCAEGRCGNSPNASAQQFRSTYSARRHRLWLSSTRPLRLCRIPGSHPRYACGQAANARTYHGEHTDCELPIHPLHS